MNVMYGLIPSCGSLVDEGPIFLSKFPRPILSKNDVSKKLNRRRPNKLLDELKNKKKVLSTKIKTEKAMYLDNKLRHVA